VKLSFEDKSVSLLSSAPKLSEVLSEGMLEYDVCGIWLAD